MDLYLHEKLPYEIKITILDLEINRNVEDTFLPIDKVVVKMLTSFVEIPIKTKQLPVKETEESESNKEEIDEKDDESMEKTREEEENIEESKSLAESLSSFKSDHKPTVTFAVEEEKSDAQEENEASTSKWEEQLNVLKEDSAQKLKGVTIVESNLRILKQKKFKISGFIINSTPLALSQHFEDKPIVYEIVKDEEVLAFARHKVTRAFIAQLCMRGFQEQQFVIRLDLRKPSNNVTAGSIMVKINILQRRHDKHTKYGRNSVAASILKW